jgi:hypothetical protein
VHFLTLDPIGLDFSDLSAPVIELLTAYIGEMKTEYGETGRIIAEVRATSRSKTNARPRQSLAKAAIAFRPRRSLDSVHGLRPSQPHSANLGRADCKNANFRRVNCKDTYLEGTNLIGADLAGERNPTREQLATAIIDETTVLPSYLVTSPAERG